MAEMPTRGEEKLRSTETTCGDGSSWLWVMLMTRGLCWQDSSCIPVGQSKERSDQSSFRDLLLVHICSPHMAAGKVEDPASRGRGQQ